MYFFARLFSTLLCWKTLYLPEDLLNTNYKPFCSLNFLCKYHMTLGSRFYKYIICNHLFRFLSLITAAYSKHCSFIVFVIQLYCITFIQPIYFQSYLSVHNLILLRSLTQAPYPENLGLFICFINSHGLQAVQLLFSRCSVGWCMPLHCLGFL